MSSPSHPTSNIEDAFSSNFPDYIPASSDYVPASPGKTYSSSSNNSFGLVPIASPTLSLFHDDLYMKVVHAYYDKESPIPLPTIIGESSRKTSLERHEEKNEEIFNHLDELSLDRIEHIEDKIEGLGKGQEKHRPLTCNADRNNGERKAPVARNCSYKELMSFLPNNFIGTKGVVGLIHWFERTESVFSRSNCTEDCKELATLYPTKVPDSEKMMEVFIGGLPRSIEGNVTASKPQTLEEAINMAQSLMDQVGHLTKNCRNKGPATGSNLLPVTVTCHACGEKGHYANQCRKTTNNNAQGRAYMLRDRNAHQNPNVVTSMFLLNQHLARVLFDSKVDKSSVSISLASKLNIPPITIDTFYNIKMADLMPIKLGSFDVVIGMDWLSKYHTRIIYDEKVIHIPIDGETLIIRVMEKKSDKKRLEDIPVVREFPE
ncbi:reverse transcriptase domain-containing protein [Tanacetum coccineum]